MSESAVSRPCETQLRATRTTRRRTRRGLSRMRHVFVETAGCMEGTCMWPGERQARRVRFAVGDRLCPFEWNARDVCIVCRVTIERLVVCALASRLP